MTHKPHVRLEQDSKTLQLATINSYCEKALLVNLQTITQNRT